MDSEHEQTSVQTGSFCKGLAGGRGWPAGPFIYPQANKTRPDHAKHTYTHARAGSTTRDSIDISYLVEFGMRGIKFIGSLCLIIKNNISKRNLNCFL